MFLREIHGNVDNAKLIIVFPPNLEFSSLFWSHTRKYSIQVNERLTEIKEKWPTIQFHVFFFHFPHSNVPNNKCHKQKWRVLFFTRIRLVACVLACARAIARIKWIRLYWLTKFYCLAAFTSWDIGQYVYCNFLLTSLWRHKFWN